MSYVFSLTSNKRRSIHNNTIQMETQNFQAGNKRIYLDAKNVRNNTITKALLLQLKI